MLQLETFLENMCPITNEEWYGLRERMQSKQTANSLKKSFFKLLGEKKQFNESGRLQSVCPEYLIKAEEAKLALEKKNVCEAQQKGSKFSPLELLKL